jgi:hypothetical protein
VRLDAVGSWGLVSRLLLAQGGRERERERGVLPVLAEIIVQELPDAVPGLEGADTTAGEVVDLLEAQCYWVKRHTSVNVIVVFVQFVVLPVVGLVVAQVLGILVHVLVEIDVRVCLEGGWVTKLVHALLDEAAEMPAGLEGRRLGQEVREMLADSGLKLAVHRVI